MSWGTHDSSYGNAVSVLPAPLASPMLLVCEHASNFIPQRLDFLGLSEEERASHIAWDPGALGVATRLAEHLEAPLVAGKISRLVYDCNRPETAPDAIPARSEVYDIPGNQSLTAEERATRIEQVYVPFRNRLSEEISQRSNLKLVVTIHSFTPVFRGHQRDVAIGILHGKDDRFAREMMTHAPKVDHIVQLNAPYGPEDGVMHTLDQHGVENGLLNVMIEIRNDLIANGHSESVMAGLLAPWIEKTLQSFALEGAR